MYSTPASTRSSQSVQEPTKREPLLPAIPLALFGAGQPRAQALRGGVRACAVGEGATCAGPARGGGRGDCGAARGDGGAALRGVAWRNHHPCPHHHHHNHPFVLVLVLAATATQACSSCPRAAPLDVPAARAAPAPLPFPPSSSSRFHTTCCSAGHPHPLQARPVAITPAAMEADDDEDFHFVGQAIEEERETRAGQHRKDVTAAASTRALPLHKQARAGRRRGGGGRPLVPHPRSANPHPLARVQEVTDEQGRRRFHGAFTGGFSAGYFNTGAAGGRQAGGRARRLLLPPPPLPPPPPTPRAPCCRAVGSKEGWTPGEFRSSRDARARAQAQSVEQFLDDDELEELRRANLQARGWVVGAWVGGCVGGKGGGGGTIARATCGPRPTHHHTHPPTRSPLPPPPPPLERRPPPTMTRLAPQPPSWLAAQRSRTSSNAPRVRVFARAQMGGLWVGGGGWGWMDARRGGLWVGGGGWMDARREGLWVGGGGWMHARRGGLWVGGGGWMDALLGRRVGGQAGGRAGNIARSVADVSAPSQHVPPDHLCSSFLPCPPCCHASACSNPWAAARGDGGASG